MVDLNECGYSDDGVPLEDLEESFGDDAWELAEKAFDEAVANRLRFSGVAYRPNDRVRLWIKTFGVRRYLWAADHAEAVIRADARSAAERAAVVKCGEGCGVDGSQGCLRKNRELGDGYDHEYVADSDVL